MKKTLISILLATFILSAVPAVAAVLPKVLAPVKQQAAKKASVKKFVLPPARKKALAAAAAKASVEAAAKNAEIKPKNMRKKNVDLLVLVTKKARTVKNDEKRSLAEVFVTAFDDRDDLAGRDRGDDVMFFISTIKDPKLDKISRKRAITEYVSPRKEQLKKDQNMERLKAIEEKTGKLPTPEAKPSKK